MTTIKNAMSTASLVGQRVTVSGLRKRPELNGETGHVERLQGDRCVVRLDSNKEAMAVSSSNVEVRSAGWTVEVEEVGLWLSKWIEEEPMKLVPVRATKILDSVRVAVEAANVDDFWEHTDDTWSQELKDRRIWQYKRGFACQNYAYWYACVLKHLVDKGATLVYRGGKQVTNVYVVNTIAFDISGLDCMRFVNRKGQESPVLATYDVLDDHLTSSYDEQAMRDFGWGKSSQTESEATVVQALRNGEIGKSGTLDAYRAAVPHWWIAVECEDCVVHLDICAAAYSWPLVEFQGRHVSFAAIEAPLYDMGRSPGEHVKHKFHYKSGVSGPYGFAPIAPPKQAARHLGSLARNDGTMVEITPLETFIDNFRPAGKFRSFVPPVDVFAAERMRQITPGTKVVLSGLKSRNDLNGRPARVVKRDGDRIGVQLLGDETPEENKPIALKPESIVVLDTVANQYRSLKEMIAREARENPKPPTPPPPSEEDLAKLRAVDLQDPDVLNVMRRFTTGNFLFSHLADPGVLRGFEILVKSGFTKSFGDPEHNMHHRRLALAKEPQAKDAFTLMTILSKAKQQAVEAGELTRHPRLPGYQGYSDSFTRTHRSVVNRLNANLDLLHFFDKLEQEGLYPNPARHPL